MEEVFELLKKIGTYYLAELLHRCDNSLLQAFFSYNAGITRVRRWLKSSLTEFGTKSKLPMDLFLETLPYTETREYGRKLVSAATMYDFLENPQNFSHRAKILDPEYTYWGFGISPYTFSNEFYGYKASNIFLEAWPAEGVTFLETLTNRQFFWTAQFLDKYKIENEITQLKK